ncbi:hypothetical protein MMPV_002609 [Pyropia vietnamensis]
MANPAAASAATSAAFLPAPPVTVGGPPRRGDGAAARLARPARSATRWLRRGVVLPCGGGGAGSPRASCGRLWRVPSDSGSGGGGGGGSGGGGGPAAAKAVSSAAAAGPSAVGPSASEASAAAAPTASAATTPVAAAPSVAAVPSVTAGPSVTAAPAAVAPMVAAPRVGPAPVAAMASAVPAPPAVPVAASPKVAAAGTSIAPSVPSAPSRPRTAEVLADIAFLRVEMAAIAAARDDAAAAAATATTTLTRARSEAASHPRAPGLEAAVTAAAATVDRARSAVASATADYEALRSRAAAAYESLPPAARRLFGPAYNRDEADADVVIRLSSLIVPGVSAAPLSSTLDERGDAPATDVVATATAVAELHTSRFNRRGTGMWVGGTAVGETAATMSLLASLLPGSMAALRAARLPPDVADWWASQGVFAVSFGGATPVGAHDTVLAALHPRLPITARIVWGETHASHPDSDSTTAASSPTAPTAGWDAWRRRLTADLTGGTLVPADVDEFCAGLFDAGLPSDGLPADATGVHTRGLLLVDGLSNLAGTAGAAAAAAARRSVADWAAASRVRVITSDVSPVVADRGGKRKGKAGAGDVASRPPKLVVIGAD